MRTITLLARGAAWLLVTAAKTLGSMHGAKPFADEHAAQQHRRRADYRP
jgi:hypothetical protein